MRPLRTLFCVLWPLLTTAAAFGQVTVVNPLTPAQQATLFHLPEGGAVMPLAFYDTLNVVDSLSGQHTGQTFAERMPVYGFLEDDESEFPVGFGTVTLDFLFGIKGLSLNCAACHVGEIHAGDTRLRILGGPNLADVRLFSQDVAYSIAALLSDPAQALRLVARTGRLSPATVAMLRDLPLIEDGKFSYRAGSPRAEAVLRQVAEILQRRHVDATPWRLSPSRSRRELWQSEDRNALAPNHPPLRMVLQAADPADDLPFDLVRDLLLLMAEVDYFSAQLRFPLSTREGFGRLDAFATVRFLMFPDQSADFPFTAPVSVPHLWDTGNKKWLHWNSNTNATLQRNIVQALGVGAVGHPWGPHNVLLPNLATLEPIAESITSPVWPADVFGPLDADLIAHGEELYTARCASCHEAGTVDPVSGLIEYPLFSLAETGTDPNHALNFHRPVGRKPFPQALSERVSTLERWYFDFRDILHPVPPATRVAWSGGPSRLPAQWRDPLASGVDAPVYAGLPLNGVWATAPYLHNNSVPTLRDLLKPAQDRPAVFQVGQRDYDPINIGYLQPADPGTIPDRQRFDTSQPGNSNAGHEFGLDGLSPDDIDALLEYLKSL